MRAQARQEKWVRMTYSAKALGGSAMELASLPEPDFTYWFERGLMLNLAENEAFQQDEIERAIERGLQQGHQGGM